MKFYYYRLFHFLLTTFSASGGFIGPFIWDSNTYLKRRHTKFKNTGRVQPFLSVCEGYRKIQSLF